MLSAFSQVSAFVTPELSGLVGIFKAHALSVMGLIFAAGLFFRVLLFLSVKGQAAFTKAFEKQVRDLSGRAPTMVNPFHVSAKETLEATLQSASFRKGLANRLLLIREGATRLTKDTVAQLQSANGSHAFYEISRTVFAKNHLFNRIMGVAPVGTTNAFLNAVPGMFVLIGVVGCLLSLFAILPAFVGAADDLSAVEKGMSQFYQWLTPSLNTALIAGGFALATIVLNFLMAPERMYVRMVDRFANTLEELQKISGAKGPSEIAVRRSAPSEEAKEVGDDEVTGDFTPGAMPVVPPEMSAEDIVADLEARDREEHQEQVEEAAAPPEEIPAEEEVVAAAPEPQPEEPEDSQITKIEEVALDAEELRKLQMYDHPEEAAMVEGESLTPLAPAPPALDQENLSVEEALAAMAPAEEGLSDIDKALWGNTSAKLDDEANEVEWTAQAPEQAPDAESVDDKEENLEENFPKKPPKAA